MTRVLVHVDAEVLSDPERPGCSYLPGIGALSAHGARRLACDAAVSEAVYHPEGRVEPAAATRRGERYDLGMAITVLQQATGHVSP